MTNESERKWSGSPDDAAAVAWWGQAWRTHARVYPPLRIAPGFFAWQPPRWAVRLLVAELGMVAGVGFLVACGLLATPARLVGGSLMVACGALIALVWWLCATQPRTSHSSRSKRSSPSAVTPASRQPAAA